MSSTKTTFNDSGEVSQIDHIRSSATEIAAAEKVKKPSKKSKIDKVAKKSKLKTKRIGGEREYHLRKQASSITDPLKAGPVDQDVKPDPVALADVKEDESKDKSKDQWSTAETTETLKSESKQPISQTPLVTPTDTFAKTSALHYLATYIHDKPSWKFAKVRQAWIIKNIWYQHMMDNENFKDAVSYLEGAGEGVKKSVAEEAREFIESSYQESESGAKTDAISSTILKRAKKIIKTF